VLVLAVGLLSGCAGSAKIVTLSEVSSDQGVQARAGDFWQATDVPRSGKEHPRVVIAEFSLEYVRGEQVVDISESMRLELPGVLYPIFEQTIAEFGGKAIPLSKVSTATAYGRLRGTDFSEVQLAALDVKPSVHKLHPVDGLRVLEDSQSDIEQVMADLLHETDADVVLVVRLRLGLHEGRAAIREGSSLSVYTAGRSGHLESKCALVSDYEIVERGASIAVVDSSALDEAARDLFHPYIAMALAATR
jgi:hypothetical protein